MPGDAQPDTSPTGSRTPGAGAASPRPVIGLPGRRQPVGRESGYPASLHHMDVDVYFTDYARAVLAAGGIPLHLPLDLDPVDAIELVDGLVLPGGADVDPSRYGHDDEGSHPDPQRDEIELALFQAARRHQRPVLGVCRGFQLINVANGGTLHQHVPAHSRYDVDADQPVHFIAFQPGSILHHLYGPGLETNSLHHQVLDRLGQDLTVTATAPDGVPEGFESADGQVLAVQWHPEMMGPDATTFRWLVDRIRSNRQ